MFLEEDCDDEQFSILVFLHAFPRGQRVRRPRKDHLTWWRDNEFFNRFRLSKSTVRFIVRLIHDSITTDEDNTVSPEDKVLLTLRYFATGSMLVVCGDFIGIHKSTASHIVKLVSYAIATLSPQFIHFPSNETDIEKVKEDFFNIAKFPWVIGALGCTHIKISPPGGFNAEVYENRKRFFSINVQIICDANLKIQGIVTGNPGSSHDSTIFNNSRIREKFENGEMKDQFLVADKGYDQNDYVMTPVGNPHMVIKPESYITEEGINKYNEALIRTRNSVERSYGVWKRRFPILATGINVNVAPFDNVIIATAALHNIACEFGESTPTVTNEIESLIEITDFNNSNDEIGVGNETRNKTRKRLLRYFHHLH